MRTATAIAGFRRITTGVAAMLLIWAAQPARAQVASEPQTPALNMAVAIPDQDPAATPAKPTRSFFGALWHNLGDDLSHMPRKNSIYWLAGGGALALAAHPSDHKLNRHLLGSSLANTIFTPGQYVGSTYVQMATSLTTYVVGHTKNEPRVEHIGMDLLEAQILSEGIVDLMKYAVRRPRPLNADGTPTANTYSFPSGHATVTFATATVLQQHFGWQAGVPTFALATYVATSRLHDNRHYLSDVVFGAAVGIVIGRSVTWHGRNTYTIATTVRPGGLGALITW